MSTESRQRLDADRYCPECGYSLQGLFEPGTCPECARRYFVANRWKSKPPHSAADTIWLFCLPALFALVGCVLICYALPRQERRLLLLGIAIALGSLILGLVKPWTASAVWLKEFVPPGRRRVGVIAAMWERSPFVAACFLLSWFPHVQFVGLTLFAVYDQIRRHF
jgi:hypothetical protein